MLWRVLGSNSSSTGAAQVDKGNSVWEQTIEVLNASLKLESLLHLIEWQLTHEPIVEHLLRSLRVM
jgi:hypothetical protein